MLGTVASEFDKLEFGDKRLTARVVMLASKISENPELSLNAACGSFKASKSAYRFFDNERISPARLLQQHTANTVERIRESKSPILIIQDTTDLIYTQFPSIEGLGDVCKSEGYVRGVKGIQLHSSIAVTRSGVPLGVLKQTYFTYNDVRAARGQSESHVPEISKDFSINKKASFRWIEHFKATHECLQGFETVHVADREGDIYEFLQLLKDATAKFVIRSCMNRRTHEGPRSRDSDTIEQKLKSAPEAGRIRVQKDNEELICVVKSSSIILKPPHRKSEAHYIFLKPLEINLVEVKGKSKKGEVSWRLLTNLPCSNMNEIMNVIDIYKLRWSIECFHRILKSGFGVEKSRLNHRVKIEKLSTILSIISWHIFWLYRFSRSCPNLPIEKIFEKETIKVLLLSARNLEPKYRSCKTIEQSVLIIARLGGFLGRKSDGPPGMINIWRGWRVLQERLLFMESMAYG